MRHLTNGDDDGEEDNDDDVDDDNDDNDDDDDNELYLCLDNEDQDARNQFLEEIELMKAIGSHKNVVSMLGCCVISEPIFLLLEYLPFGDLQNWLRNKRLEVENKSKSQLNLRIFSLMNTLILHAMSF